MTQFAARNTPTGAGGFVSGTLAGAQLLRDVVAIPAGANAAWLQADADVGMRMDGIAGGDYQALPAGTFLPLTNRTQMDLLVLNGSAQVRVQFFYGTVGPMASAPIAGNGGGPPPVPPLTELVTQNVVHVMKNGNDGTGQRNRMDLPFLTLAAARAVMVSGDTMIVWPGDYTAMNLSFSGGTYTVLRLGAVLRGTNVSGHMFTIGASCTFHLAGWGELIYSFRTAGRSIIRCLGTLGNDSYVTVQGDAVSEETCAIVAQYAHLSWYGNMRSNYGACLDASGSASSGSVYGNLQAAISTCVKLGAVAGGAWVIHGSITSPLTPVQVDGGTLDVIGNIYAAQNVQAVQCAGGLTNLWGDVRGSVSCSGGILKTHGNVFAASIMNHTVSGTGRMELLAGGTGNPTLVDGTLVVGGKWGGSIQSGVVRIGDDGTCFLMPDCCIAADGFGGIPPVVNLGTTPTVYSAGAWGFNAPAAGITVDGVFNLIGYIP